MAYPIRWFVPIIRSYTVGCRYWKGCGGWL